MHLIFLGTASCYPTRHRSVSCTAVKFPDGDVWLFDCGEGAQLQIQKSSVRPSNITKIFITHLHGDHLFGLPGVMCTLSQIDNHGDFILEIYGPLGLRRYLRETFNLSRSELTYKWVVHELMPEDWQSPEEIEKWKIPEEAENLLHPQEISGVQIACTEDSWTLLNDNHASVKAGGLIHRVPTFGFTLHLPDTRGTLDIDYLTSLGLKPGCGYGRLTRGESILLDDGQIIHPQDAMGPPTPGLKMTILGDTCDSTRMAHIAKDSDVILHEATYENRLEEQAITRGHSTPSMAANFASRINAKHLILFHFSQRYKLHDNPSVNILREEAEEAFLKLGYECKTSLAEDLLEIDLTKRRLKKKIEV